MCVWCKTVLSVLEMSTQQREMRQKREKQMSEWQPPKSASSSDSDTDDDTPTQAALSTRYGSHRSHIMQIKNSYAINLNKFMYEI